MQCAVALPRRPADAGRWIYEWHDDVLGYPEEKLKGVLYDLAMRHSPKASLELGSAMQLMGLGEEMTETGGFLALYSLLQGGTEVSVLSGSCAHSIGRIILPFALRRSERSLFTSILITLARAPLLAPFMGPRRGSGLSRRVRR